MQRFFSIFSALILLCTFAFGSTHEISQHVHLSTADAGHAWVTPAPAAAIGVEMRHISTRFSYVYQVENLDADSGMLYGGSWWCSHVVTHGQGQPVDWGFFGGSQTGTSCGMHDLAPFDGIADYSGSSGVTAPASFQSSFWPDQPVNGVELFKRHRAGQLHELFYQPAFQATMTYEDANGNAVENWSLAEQWLPGSALDFDLVYIVAD